MTSAVVLLLALAAASKPAAAQIPRPAVAAPATIAFTGAIFSDEGQPLPGATVAIEGKAHTTAIANSEGFFLMQVPAGTPLQLLVSFPAHESQRVEIKAPEKEKNLVVTLRSLGRVAPKSRNRPKRN